MPEIRQSMATKEWVIIATERARRPHEFRQETHECTDCRPAWQAECPFCPGNETPDERETYRDPPQGPWQVRAMGNKYPALQRDGDRVRQFDGIHRRLTGIGHHEVIVETPSHNTCIALMPVEQVARTLAAFQTRGRDLSQDARMEHIVYFENHGPEAGTSLDHPHAQMVALPVVPYQVRCRVEEAGRYFDDTGNCVHCEMWRDELSAGERVITQNEHFVAFTPYAALSPFHTWIMPRQHRSSFLEATEEELRALAQALRDVLRRLYVGLRDPDYNYIIRTAPLHAGEQESLHWYLSVVPRLAEAAGFEMGSGMFINTALPEESAGFLRSIELPTV